MYQFSWFEWNFHIHGYLISWFLQSLRTFLQKIVNSFNIWNSLFTCTHEATKIGIQLVLMNREYFPDNWSGIIFDQRQYIWEILIYDGTTGFNIIRRCHSKIKQLYLRDVVFNFEKIVLITQRITKKKPFHCTL